MDPIDLIEDAPRLFENRFLPWKEEQWNVTSRTKTKRFIEKYPLEHYIKPVPETFGPLSNRWIIC